MIYWYLVNITTCPHDSGKKRFLFRPYARILTKTFDCILEAITFKIN